MKTSENNTRVVIFGTGDCAVLMHTYLTHDSPYDVVAFTADSIYCKENHLLGLPIVQFEKIRGAFPPSNFNMLIAMGYSDINKNRALKYKQAKAMGYQLITYVSSKVTIWPNVQLGDNCIIVEDQTIQPNVTIGNNVILLGGQNHIGHHSIIGDHCYLSTHAVICGHVKVGPYCFLGANCTVRDNVVVAPECIIGSGATIIEDTVRNGVYIGKAATL